MHLTCDLAAIERRIKHPFFESREFTIDSLTIRARVGNVWENQKPFLRSKEVMSADLGMLFSVLRLTCPPDSIIQSESLWLPFPSANAAGVSPPSELCGRTSL
jgi:hypothetical protein